MIPSQTTGAYLALFADDTCMYATDRKEGYVLRKLQRGLNQIKTWCKHWKIKINGDMSRTVYFSYTIRPPEIRLECPLCKIRWCNYRQEDYMETAYTNDRSRSQSLQHQLGQ
jgi:hypothetical protein